MLKISQKAATFALLLAASSLLAQSAKAAPPAPAEQQAHLKNASLHTRLTSTTALTVASSVGEKGPAVTMVATVDSLAGSAPGGSISFAVEGKQVAEVPVNHGSASYTVTTLPSGKSSLSATYRGDDNFLPSKSAVVHYYRDADE